MERFRADALSAVLAQVEECARCWFYGRAVCSYLVTDAKDSDVLVFDGE